MKIQQVKINKLKPYERNNRKHPDSQIEKLAKQIETHGFDVPIVVDANFVIIKGHCRLKAAKKLGMDVVPVVVRDDLTAEQVKSARIADNRLAELAELDIDALQLEFDDLKNIDFDVQLTGYDTFSVLPAFEPDLPSEEESEKKEKPLTLLITCSNEDERQALFCELNDRGLKVKA